ncbi:quinone-dependent dihydroorotate dehydrogenase [Anaplasma phagocytophilum]|uniref:Dihydroorotate dehydrogenase (quinone) n=3 Tax=Anaplasma phagocytophilum TaxID=948 RepID=Q2GJ77_ANAPZ|nr:quinone-dependent dihydroorotate dehydrogenase [Anaplasma phagocytophilum]KJZ98673.1 dihydroorotate dehydrogenase [Anaplasma phagocytophilum str. CR1007]ABD43616.1 dihydroorotate dehydrogenase [Anaplasma phagocytophilum str. HZ]AGR78981.1 diguanylate cyclase [Anaplasma phagocytophilum str. HZ2]AGR80228.1 diguanylate cyclase [Anaplasma phagocytophilum str. JM]AGR81482.1 diguanylate cyclase [Anaplasma phagocytophilum str. Dog2]
MSLFRFNNPLFLIPPKVAHSLTLFALQQGLYSSSVRKMPECLSAQPLNFKVRTPIGLAAGFDKNAEVIRPVLSLGFGFTEVGTVTKYPQSGNKGPRLFRMHKQKAVINRLGFNNKGLTRLLKKVDSKDLNNLVFGINVGMYKGCSDPPAEYAELVQKVYGLSSYITINLSSPNTAGLRELQKRNSLNEILASVRKARYAVDHAESVPILLKIDPDLSDEVLQDVVDEVLRHKINGIIVSNTTTNFKLLGTKAPISRGGLSGQPLFSLSTRVLADVYSQTRGRVVLVGCGGVSSGAQALEKIRAGASLVQLYTAIVYGGFGIIDKINMELADLLTRDGFNKVEQAVGIDVH